MKLLTSVVCAAMSAIENQDDDKEEHKHELRPRPMQPEDRSDEEHDKVTVIMDSLCSMMTACNDMSMSAHMISQLSNAERLWVAAYGAERKCWIVLPPKRDSESPNYTRK